MSTATVTALLDMSHTVVATGQHVVDTKTVDIPVAPMDDCQHLDTICMSCSDSWSQDYILIDASALGDGIDG